MSYERLLLVWTSWMSTDWPATCWVGEPSVVHSIDGCLIEPRYASKERAQQLQMMLSTAPWDEDPSQFVKDFYLAVCDLYEDDWQRSHYQFAHFLRGKSRERVNLCVCINSVYSIWQKRLCEFARFATQFTMSRMYAANSTACITCIYVAVSSSSSSAKHLNMLIRMHLTYLARPNPPQWGSLAVLCVRSSWHGEVGHLAR